MPDVCALTTGHFDRRVVKFTRTYPELKKPLTKALRHLEANPFLLSLRLHPLGGELEGLMPSASPMPTESP